MSYYFAQPWALVGLLLAPAYLGWYLLWYAPRRLRFNLSYDPQRLPPKGHQFTWLRWLPIALQLSAVALACIALARPQLARNSRTVRAQGLDVMLVLDASKSMLTPDVLPTRLEAAKKAAIQLLNARPGDRVGIVLCAQNAFSYAPLTLDHALLQKLILQVNPNLLPNDGTALGPALGIAIQRLAAATSPSPVIVVFTDGVGNVGSLDGLAAAGLAARRGIRLYTVAVGRLTYYGVDAQGRLGAVTTELDTKLLQQMASTTGGTSLTLMDTRAMAGLLTNLTGLVSTLAEQHNERDVQDAYPGFLLAALCCLALAYLLIGLGYHNLLEE